MDRKVHAYKFGHRDTFCGIAVRKHPTEYGYIAERSRKPIVLSDVLREVTCNNCLKCVE